MKRIRYSLFCLWMLFLAVAALRSYPVPLTGGLELLRSLAGLGLLLGALIATGRALLLRFKAPAGSLSQEILFSFALGCVLMSVLMFLLGHFGALNQVSAWLLVAGFWTLGFKHLEHFFTELRHSLRTKHPWEGSSTEMLSLLAAGISTAVVFALCLAPVSFYDALVYHLALPQKAAALGYSVPIAGNLYSWLPGGAERLWTLCILLDGGGTAFHMAALFNFTFCLATALAVTDAGARFLPRPQLWLPAALFLTQPLLALSYGVFGSDGVAAFFTFLSLSAFLNTLGERKLAFRASGLYLAALLAGFAVAVKPVALVHAAALLILFAWKALYDEDDRQPALLAAVAGFFILPLLPWMIRNFTLVGNPFMPFGLSLFGTEIFKSASNLYFDHLRSFAGEAHFWSLPWDLTFGVKGGAFGGGGPLSFLFLGILPVVLVARLVREMKWLSAYLFVSALLWTLGPRVLRYAIPALPGLMILCAACLAEVEIWARSKGLSLVLRLFIVGALFLGTAQVAVIAVHGFDPFGVALGIQNPEDYLVARGVNTAPAAAWLQARAPKARLLVLGDSRSAGLPPESFACTVFEENPFKQWLAQAKSPHDLDAILTQKGYDFALLNLTEMSRVENGPGPHYDYFSSPDSARLFDTWIQSHAGKGYSGDGVELFPLL